MSKMFSWSSVIHLCSTDVGGGLLRDVAANTSSQLGAVIKLPVHMLRALWRLAVLSGVAGAAWHAQL